MLKNGRAIFTTSSNAQRTAEFLHGFQAKNSVAASAAAAIIDLDLVILAPTSLGLQCTLDEVVDWASSHLQRGGMFARVSHR